MSLSGAVCSVMLYSNLAWSVDNQVTLEFSTPHGIAPDGVLLCATALDHRFDRSTFVVNALEEGGSQFLAGVSQTVAGATDADLLSVRAFSGATTWNHRPVETGVAADVLGLDARYAETYARRRYDDMTHDAAGNALDGVFQDPAWQTDAATRAHLRVIASLWAASTRVLLLPSCTSSPVGQSLPSTARRPSAWDVRRCSSFSVRTRVRCERHAEMACSMLGWDAEVASC